MKLGFSFPLILLLAFCICAQRQKEPKQSRPVAVEANLTVLDSNGKQVENFRREDIKIFEDGVQQKLLVLERKDPGLILGIAIDNSGSMREQITRLEEIALAVVNELTPIDQTMLVRFVSSEKLEVLDDFTTDKEELIKTLKEALYVEGGQSAVNDAVYLSIERLMGRGGRQRHALILLSDCGDVHSFYNADQLFSLVSKANVQIFPIVLPGIHIRGVLTSLKSSKDKANNLARELALTTGGNALILGEKAMEADLQAKLKEIFAELRAHYVVRYISTNPKRDGLARSLRVEIADGPNGEKRTAKVRESFVVPLD